MIGDWLPRGDCTIHFNTDRCAAQDRAFDFAELCQLTRDLTAFQGSRKNPESHYTLFSLDDPLRQKSWPVLPEVSLQPVI